VTVTQGIKVEAQAVIFHLFCRFDKESFEDAPKYFFVYNMRISAQLPALPHMGGPSVSKS